MSPLTQRGFSHGLFPEFRRTEWVKVGLCGLALMAPVWPTNDRASLIKTSFRTRDYSPGRAEGILYQSPASAYPLTSCRDVPLTGGEVKGGFTMTHIRSRVSSVVEHSSANPDVLVRFRARSHARVMDYDEACFMHLTPAVVHNFPKAVGV